MKNKDARHNRINISDVARLSGFSRATVSRVFNNPESVSPNTREMVLRAAEKLDYYPSATARSLATGRNYMFGVIAITREESMVEISSWDFYLRILQGITGVVKAPDLREAYRCWLDTDTYESIERSDLLQQLARSAGIDGLVIILQWSFPESFIWQLGQLHRSGFPFVVVNYSMEDFGFASTCIDSRKLGEKAIQHFLSMGRRRIAWIAGPQLNLSAQERTDGYWLSMQEAGIEIPDGYVQVSEFNPGDGYRCMRSLIDLANPPDAVVCANDQIAAGALRAICDSGLRCPEDIMLIGVDNSEITIVTSPTLSSFELPLYQMGQYAARVLLNQLRDECVPENVSRKAVRYIPKLITRGSTKCC